MKDKIKNHFKGNYRVFYRKYLKEIKRDGSNNEFKALCPFHNDNNPSLNFNNQHGKYFCHSCEAGGDVFHFYAKNNDLDLQHDFTIILKGIADDFDIPWEGVMPKTEKTYDYTDANGNLIFQVCRYKPKDFRQRRPDGRGGWIWNLNGINPILYNLPQVIKANEIFIVEGEKDADSLNALELAATTCPMGVKKWRDEYNEPLKGKNIILIPDNDQVGREHMQQVAASLKGNVKSIKVIELPELPPKGDVSDFIGSFDDKKEAAEKLSIIIEGTLPYEPPKEITLDDAVIEAEDFINSVDLPPKDVILNPWLTEQTIILISATRGIGKTWLAMGLVNAITRGEQFGPWELKKSVPCMYIEGEMAAQDVKSRLAALNKNKGPRKKPLFIYSDAYASYLNLSRASLVDEEWRSKIQQIAIEKDVKIIVVDNITSLTPGLDENSRMEWSSINEWLLRLRFEGITAILIHHTGKMGTQRGTSAREDNIDTSIMLQRPKGYRSVDGAKFIMDFTKSRGTAISDLSLIGAYQFQLGQNQSGELIWTYGDSKVETKKEVLKMLDEEDSQVDIANALQISSGYVSQIRKKAIKDGLLSSNNKLTDSGKKEVFGE